MKKEYVSSKIIIAGFPGVGKSEAAKLIPGVVMDVESSDYHWNEDKSLNPLWPDNYLDYVKILLETDGLEEYRDLLYICISTHADTLKRLRKLQIPFVIAVPEDKEETIARYRERGNSEAFESLTIYRQIPHLQASLQMGDSLLDFTQLSPFRPIT